MTCPLKQAVGNDFEFKLVPDRWSASGFSYKKVKADPHGKTYYDHRMPPKKHPSITSKPPSVKSKQRSRPKSTMSGLTQERQLIENYFANN